MNERIKELHNQARDFYLQDEYLDVSTKELHRLVEQKFAELIVRECMSICEDLGDKGLDGHYCVDKIRKEFGV